MASASLLSLHLLISAGFVSPLFVENADEFLEAGFKQHQRLGKVQDDITVIEVRARLMFMVEDISLVDKKRVTLELSAGEEEWVVVSGAPVVRGGTWTWTEDITSPCVAHRVRLWVHTEAGTQQSFTSPSLVPAVSSDVLQREKFRPAAPRLLETVQTLYALVVSWEPSACSQSYLVSYRSLPGGETVSREVAASSRPSLLLTDNLQPCTEYEVKVVAALGGTYSQETTKIITTAPTLTSADRLEIKVTPGRDHATVRWSPGRDLPCITSYNVSLCRQAGDCLHSRAVDVLHRHADTEILFSENDTLRECQSYFLKVFPIYYGKKMREKVVHFHTLFPPLANFASQLGPVEVRLLAGPAVRLSWQAVRCASHYQARLQLVMLCTETVMLCTDTETANNMEPLHQVVRQDQDGSTAEVVSLVNSSTRSLPEVTVKAEHCRRYSLGIRTSFGSHGQTEIVPVQSVVTEIENPEYYILPNFEVKTELEGAVLSWEHRPCIQSYRVKLCQENYSDKICYEKQLLPTETEKDRISDKMINLKMCSVYSYDVFTLYNSSEIKTKTTHFTTKSQVQNPKNVKITLDAVKDKVTIQWDPVKCAKSYKIFQKFAASSSRSQWTYLSNKEKVRLNSPEPCSVLSYGVSAMFSEQESLPPEWFPLSIPPKLSSAHFPVLTIRNHLNFSSSSFIIEGTSRFSNCKVAVYQVRQEGSTEVSTFKTSPKGKINIEMAQGNKNIEMRVKYHGFEGWSQWQWVASDALRSEQETDAQLHTTLLILLGCFLLLVVWLLLITLAVLCSRHSNNNQAESVIKSPAGEEHFSEKEEHEEVKEKDYISEPPDVIQPVKLWYV